MSVTTNPYNPYLKNKFLIAGTTFVSGYLRLLEGLGGAAFGFPLSAGFGAFLGTVLVHAFVTKDLRTSLKSDLLIALQLGVYGVVLGYASEMVLGNIALFNLPAGLGAVIVPLATAVGVYTLA